MAPAVAPKTPQCELSPEGRYSRDVQEKARQQELQRQLRRLDKQMHLSLKQGPRPKEEDLFSNGPSGKYKTLTHSLVTSPREGIKAKTIEVGAVASSINDPVLKRYINTDLEDYFETKAIANHHKCIDCAKCLLPTGGKMIRYRYP